MRATRTRQQLAFDFLSAQTMYVAAYAARFALEERRHASFDDDVTDAMIAQAEAVQKRRSDEMHAIFKRLVDS